MVTITKTAQLALTVDAVEYVKLINGNAVWLITAAPKTKLPATKSLYYGDTAMFWSEKYEAYAWLLVGKGTAQISPPRRNLRSPLRATPLCRYPTAATSMARAISTSTTPSISTTYITSSIPHLTWRSSSAAMSTATAK